MLHWSLVVTAVVCVTGMAVVGIAAVMRGWVPPFGRRRVLRPRLWGVGALMSALGLGLFMFLGPMAAHDLAVNPYVPPAGMAVNLAGLAVQMLAQRPGHAPRLPPTPTTSAS
ncbi:hypothetical protein [Streptomyces sp. SLBN-115]|uniref:hypothetical protein n=1 Tax=Streptomyces sp. SLBN-115 TaxID=2768453 RepID=UPI00114E7D3A|nr:hypothetical protein [Streptomyces sp. SLBN-115]TQJ55478.1 hypothetical protein FBY34_3277 [Streptomyces sp. SLBN-115]